MEISNSLDHISWHRSNETTRPLLVRFPALFWCRKRQHGIGLPLLFTKPFNFFNAWNFIKWKSSVAYIHRFLTPRNLYLFTLGCSTTFRGTTQVSYCYTMLASLALLEIQGTRGWYSGTLHQWRLLCFHNRGPVWPHGVHRTLHVCYWSIGRTYHGHQRHHCLCFLLAYEERIETQHEGETPEYKC